MDESGAQNVSVILTTDAPEKAEKLKTKTWRTES
jgi:hypothetical protein